MKSRRALIRLRKWHIDEIRRRLAELEVMRQDFISKRDEIDSSVADERQFGQSSPIGAFAYPTFARAMTARRDKIERSIHNIEQEIEGAKGELADAYGELKKFETLEENRKQRVRQQHVQQEQIELDEIALKGHQRDQAAR